MLNYILYTFRGTKTSDEAIGAAVQSRCSTGSDDKYKHETEDIIRLFFPEYSVTELAGELDGTIIQAVGYDGGTVTNHVKVIMDGAEKVSTNSGTLSYEYGSEEFVRYYKRIVKHGLYLALKAFTGKPMPWGSLTGIRPTRIGYELMDGDYRAVQARLMSVYDVSSDKAALTAQVLRTQKGLYQPGLGGAILYVNIPICLTRCNYCSFISAVYSKCKHLLEDYITKLEHEIAYSVDKAVAAGVRIKSVYIGGGTPTAIGIPLLERVVRAVRQGVGEGLEFTVEAGRPEGINDAVLNMLSLNGVTRISINPQTFKDETLVRIGRGHTSADVYRAYESAAKYPFVINMDLIAGLDSETEQDFGYSLTEAINLNPHNITVHSLSIKGGSKLKEKGVINRSGVTSGMTELAYKRLQEAGFSPYYMYRQKYTLGNTENTGYTREGYGCAYNVDAMEESASVIACGAGAISKALGGGGSIKRSANYKNLEDYIGMFETVLQRKDELLGWITAAQK